MILRNDLLDFAAEILGSEDKSREWLESENLALGNRRPVNLLSTKNGFEEVTNALGRFEFGVYS